MIITALAGRMPGRLNIGGLAAPGPLGPAASAAQQAAEAAAEEKAPNIYDNFQKEMTRRLGAGAKDQDGPDPEILAQSLTHAMGEIEKNFGKEAATEAMALILNGTAEKADAASITGSVGSALRNLARRDPNGAKIRSLTDSFNKDLALAFDPEKGDELAAGGAAVSLSYAISRHFGLLANPDDYFSRTECRGLTDDTPARPERDLSGYSPSGDAPAPSGGWSAPVEAAEAPPVRQKNPLTEVALMAGFDESGQWGQVEVAKPDAEYNDELKERAREALDKAADLSMGALIDPQLGNARNLVEGFIKFLRHDLGDDEAAAHMEEGLKAGQKAVEEKVEDLRPGFMDQLSQVYAKIAAEGDEAKLANFENYVNGDFKDSLNETVAAMQTDVYLPLAEEIGQIEFQGLTGLSPSGESDAFSLRWGFKDDGYVDKTITKKVMAEDFQSVKKAAEKKASGSRAQLEMAKAQREDEKALREAGYAVNSSEMAESEGAPPSLGYVAPGYSHIKRDAKQNRKIWDELELSQAREPGAEEKAAENLDQALALKAGQISPRAMDDLKEFLTNRLGDEAAEEMMGQLDWNDDLMTGLSAVGQKIAALGQDGRAEEFVAFLNRSLKGEVERLTEKIGHIDFEGFANDPDGQITARYTVLGEEGPKKINVAALANQPHAPAPAGSGAEAILAGATPALAKRTNQTGLLIRARV